MNPICIVDDQPDICSAVSGILADEGYKTVSFQDAESFWQSLDTQEPSLVLLDIWLPGVDGLELLKRLHERFPKLPVIMMSGQATLSDAVTATKRGAFHFIEKPLGPEAVLLTVQAALEVSRARDLTRALQAELGPEAELIGKSPAILEVRELIRKIADTDARVRVGVEAILRSTAPDELGPVLARALRGARR